MDKSKAIDLLKQQLNEIPQLRELHHDNQKFRLWHNKVRDILKAALDTDDLKTFSSRQSILVGGIFKDDVYQKNYLDRLTDYETALRSIIQKYEILGIEEKPATGPAEATEDYEEKAVTKELELFLEGSPDMILECIRSTTENLNSQGYTYSFRRTSGAPDYAKWDKTYFASCAISQGDEGQIGTIKLQLLPKEQTSVKYVEPRNWDSSFGHFLNCLFAEFHRLGFVDLEEDKPAAKAEPKEAAESPVNLFDKMQFHPRVIAASKSLFRDGHYAQAILEAQTSTIALCDIDYILVRAARDWTV